VDELDRREDRVTLSGRDPVTNQELRELVEREDEE